MEKRIEDKINEIEKYLLELEEMKPTNLEEYKRDIKTKAACERYIEKIIEALVDLSFLIIKDKSLKSPENDTEAFIILSDSNIISNELSDKMQNAKGMRNILAHEYGEVDDEIVFHSLEEEIIKDSRDFIKSIKILG